MIADRIMEWLEGASSRPLDPLIERRVEQAAARLEWSFKRQFADVRAKEPVLRASGWFCVRKKWYEAHGCPQEPIPAHTRLDFLVGDVVEEALATAAYLAGCQIEFRNEDVSFNIYDADDYREGVLIAAHIDNLLWDDISQTFYVVEFKSMSDFGFRDFMRNGLSNLFGYVSQCQIYMEATGVPRALIVAYRKSSGRARDLARGDKLAERIIEYDPAHVDRIREEARAAVADDPPPRPFPAAMEYTGWGRSRKATGKRIVPKAADGAPCCYCPFVRRCWGDLIAGEKEDEQGEVTLYV